MWGCNELHLLTNHLQNLTSLYLFQSWHLCKVWRKSSTAVSRYYSPDWPWLSLVQKHKNLIKQKRWQSKETGQHASIISFSSFSFSFYLFILFPVTFPLVPARIVYEMTIFSIYYLKHFQFLVDTHLHTTLSLMHLIINYFCSFGGSGKKLINYSQQP